MIMTTHPRDRRLLGYLAGLAIAMAIGVAALPPLPEPQLSKGLADNRTLLGIPNFLNVASNLPFVLVGVWGLHFLSRSPVDGGAFIDPRERWPYVLCFLGVALTCFGSIYHHLAIDSAGLFWDRLPMTIAFTALLSAVIVERIGVSVGLRLLIPLILAGMGSVLYWRWSVLYATENLLPYALVQYGSIAAILSMAAVYPARYTRGADMVLVVAIYGFAKAVEVLDTRIYALGEIVSGHTLKHLIAALAAYWLLRMLRLRSPR
jgi:hypothetical protein